jgi:NADP-dependent 3-hydroxy acid dehydrogenase YdfG
MEKDRKKIIITGSTSKISKLLIKDIKNKNLKIYSCTRNKGEFNYDFANQKSILKFIKFLKKIKPNYLFLSHGVLFGKKLHKYSKIEIQKTIFVNLISNIQILEAIENISNLNTILISSISGKLGSFDNLYAATKSGLDLTVKKISTKMKNTSRLNVISPGIIEDAKMTEIRTDFNNLKKIKNATPTKKFTTSKEVADIAKFIFFESKNIHGQNININGGLF